MIERGSGLTTSQGRLLTLNSNGEERRLIKDLEAALLAVDHVAVKELLSPGDEPALDRVEQLMVPALERIGNNWELGKASLSQVYVSGRMCEEVVDTLLPSLNDQRGERQRVALTVLEDFHLLGLRIVYSVLRASGRAPLSYGRMALEPLVERIKQDDIHLLLVSTLMLPAALRVKDLTARLRDEGLQTRVAVGGAPFCFDTELWREVGADAMGRSATDAIGIVDRLAPVPS